MSDPRVRLTNEAPKSEISTISEAVAKATLREPFKADRDSSTANVGFRYAETGKEIGVPQQVRKRPQDGSAKRPYKRYEMPALNITGRAPAHRRSHVLQECSPQRLQPGLGDSVVATLPALGARPKSSHWHRAQNDPEPGSQARSDCQDDSHGAQARPRRHELKEHFKTGGTAHCQRR